MDEFPDALTREALYHRVWSEPMTVVAATLGLSDVGVAKACRRHDIPVPPRGYWAKKNAGIAVEQPPLPPSDTKYVRFMSRAVRREREQDPEAIPEPVFPNDLAERRKIAAEKVGTVRLRDLRKTVHPGLAKVIAERAARETPNWGVSPRAVQRWERRRHTLANSVILALEGAGAKVQVTDGYRLDCCAVVDGVEVYFALETQAVVSGLSSEQADDMFAFKLRNDPGKGPSRKIWNERKKPLEEQLTDVVVSLLVAAEDNRREALRREQRKLEWDRQERIRREQRRREARQRARIEKLEADAAAYRRATDVRGLIAAARAEGDQSEEAEAWYRWAEKYALSIDPIASGTLFDLPEFDEYDFHW